ncbi:DUF1080 domain-containing protein [uncultured Arcticibacterium sp.]|uniref:3-keto-disaccharide hydrolase n=1 Tax=uncultured Arcticibacterium sp. TaxID=2173042 RepID=UPI0030F58579
MKKITIALSLALLVSFSELSAQKLKKIFNGKNLDGWVIPQPNNDNWTVSDGILMVTSDETRKGGILWTEKDYEDFIVEVEYKNVSGNIDSGIFLRSDIDQIQIGISGSLKRDLTASPYIPGKSYPVEASLKSLKKDDWNTIKVKVVGDTYTVWLNNEEVLTYTSEGMKKTGPIGIQLHPNRDMSIMYRSIKAREI